MVIKSFSSLSNCNHFNNTLSCSMVSVEVLWLWSETICSETVVSVPVWQVGFDSVDLTNRGNDDCGTRQYDFFSVTASPPSQAAVSPIAFSTILTTQWEETGRREHIFRAWCFVLLSCETGCLVKERRIFSSRLVAVPLSQLAHFASVQGGKSGSVFIPSLGTKWGHCCPVAILSTLRTASNIIGEASQVYLHDVHDHDVLFRAA